MSTQRSQSHQPVSLSANVRPLWWGTATRFWSISTTLCVGDPRSAYRPAEWLAPEAEILVNDYSSSLTGLTLQITISKICLVSYPWLDRSAYPFTYAGNKLLTSSFPCVKSQIQRHSEKFLVAACNGPWATVLFLGIMFNFLASWPLGEPPKVLRCLQGFHGQAHRKHQRS